MTAFAVGLVLAAAFFHASWNLLTKRVAGGPAFVWLFSTMAALLYLPFAVGVVMVQKPVLGPREFAFCTVSAVLHLGYFLLLMQGYRRGDLSVVYPTARATGPTLSTLAAIAFFAERPSAMALLGAALIIVGVFFLTRAPRSGRSTDSLGGSVLFGLLAGTLIGSYTLSDAYTVSVLLVPPLLLDYASSLGRSVMLAPYAYRHRREVARLWSEHRGPILGVAVLNPLAYILVLTALAFTPVSYVAPAREVSVLIAVVMGAKILGEGDLHRRLGWSVVIVAGMVILATG